MRIQPSRFNFSRMRAELMEDGGRRDGVPVIEHERR
jgi:hypothetical protein